MLLFFVINSCSEASKAYLDACLNDNSAYCVCIENPNACADGKVIDESLMETDSTATLERLPLEESNSID